MTEIKAVIFDWFGTLINKETRSLFPYSKQVLQELKNRGYELSLISLALTKEKRLAEIKAAVGKDFPLVLHGASSVPAELVKICNDNGAVIPGTMGVPEYMFTEATKLGVAKINVDTDLRLAFTGAIRKHFAENPGHFDPRQYLTPARAAVKEIVKHKIQVFGTNGRV